MERTEKLPSYTTEHFTVAVRDLETSAKLSLLLVDGAWLQEEHFMPNSASARAEPNSRKGVFDRKTVGAEVTSSMMSVHICYRPWN